jgi:predicted O-methyltransferase YrrM
MIFSADDELGRPSARLIDLAIRIINCARTIDLSDISDRIPPNEVRYPDIWPGEHYRVLAAVVVLLLPRTVIEIGTAEGLSALTLKKYLPADGRVITFDLVPWQNYPNVRLTNSDFADGRLVQVIGDLSDPAVFGQHAELLQEADVTFLDAAKDGQLEQTLLDQFATLGVNKSPLLILDDIRVWNMLKVWRQVEWPKLDLTSFGHWSGTGLIELRSPPKEIHE